jgi:aspartate/methionine/tyrosine aminotransferase
VRVEIHKLFEILLETTDAGADAFLGLSLSESPRLADYLDDLDPDLSLDWSNQSFRGLVRLREHVLTRAHLTGRCGLNDVLITAGTAEANFLAITQLVQPGDEMIVDTPGWPQPLVLGEAIGAKMIRLERREENQWRFDMDELAAQITSHTRLIFLCNPNNPTGQILDETALKDIIRLAERVGSYVLCDEVYAGLEWDVPRVPSVAGLYERGISTGSLSKTLGLQGLRTGWLICRDAGVVRDALILRENTSEIMNVMGEAITEIALRPERYRAALDKARADGLRNLERLDAFITDRSELSWQRPPAGLIGLARLHISLDSDELARRLLAPPYRTFLIPGSAHGCPRHIRLGVGGGKAAALETGLARLARLLDDLSET